MSLVIEEIGPESYPLYEAIPIAYTVESILICRVRSQTHPGRAGMANFNSDHKAVLDDLLLGHPGVRPGKMFGFPAYYAGQKLCICLYEQGVGVKLPERSAARLLEADPNVIPFMPLGKPKMREWVQINLERSQEYGQYLAVFEESIRFVLAQQAKGD